ncbi:MAG: enoyl-CoA hydratase [Rhodobacteraceae bacterium]|uniref:Enoyl-CoA hydratase/carnithine racemase n=1 Tax=Salipiger profundus TaxID=1229727 RepID=A0A1U7DA06_9RHOB|nr:MULTISPECIES: enoyl-CoA hydratase/isomerase family protein [Salipiger]APX24942.1 enoyl-CoA hydratase/carnithine racemase [Salipiger profundus]MAB07855.1 enoyl-CoA hydratase [Paracoccaceae bacterium]GFZ99050.1 enoyl-CoA hydratase [Salipiger profundus]SFC94495.1 Enoyl-CoA hydratase/carnithine racemase [Salipiger profundus]
MSTSEILLSETSGGVLKLSLNRPERRNALNEDLILELTTALEEASRNPEVRVILLTGTGEKAFCSGADLNPKAGTFGFDYANPMTAYANLLRAARRTTVPVVGRINGHCLAGGMGLLALCDMAVASRTAKFGLPEVKVGVFPMQVAALLQATVPPRRFAEMCYTGEFISAQEAMDWGLVNYVAAPEELDEKTDWLISRVADKSPTAIRRGKHALNSMAGMTTDQAIAFMEAQVGLLPLTEDAKEGMAAFAEKRTPVWTGK